VHEITDELPQDVHADLAPARIRSLIRAGALSGHTSGLAPSYAQFNLAAVPEAVAADFLLFCQKNERYMPVAEVVGPRSRSPVLLARDADLSVDLSEYWEIRRGRRIAVLASASEVWRSDLVAFLLGCSFTFEESLLASGVPLRHRENRRNVPMYRTNRQTVKTKDFSGACVVSMRPIPEPMLSTAIAVTSQFPGAHGMPISIGEPEKLGIERLERPDFGDPPVLLSGDVPVFWACAVTATEALLNSVVDFAIVHSPGHMFISDLKADETPAAPARL